MSHYDDHVDKAPGEFRIAVIGDSFTDCTNTNWPDVLHDLLNQDEQLKARLKVSNFSVLNFGRSGIGLQQFAAIYDHEVAAYHPDLVLVNFITGDIYRKFLWISPLEPGKDRCDFDLAVSAGQTGEPGLHLEPRGHRRSRQHRG